MVEFLTEIVVITGLVGILIFLVEKRCKKFKALAEETDQGLDELEKKMLAQEQEAEKK